MCWYFVKSFTYIISQQLYKVENIIYILYIRKQYNMITSPRAPWVAETGWFQAQSQRPFYMLLEMKSWIW